MARKQITDELKEDIKKFYRTKPMPFSMVCEKYGLSQPTVGKILKDEKKYAKASIYNPELIDSYFENIDTEVKAYFIGLIIADGNVFVDEKNKNANRQASISLTLESNDEYILEKFKKEVKSNTIISHDGRGCSQIAVRSNKMSEDLSRYGIIPRKSFSTYLPLLKNDLMPHLIRGIMDGDGSIAAHTIKSGRFLHSISFCGTHKLMNDISDYLYSNVNLKTKPRVYDYKNRLLSEISIRSKDDMVNFGNYIYNNSSIYLIRKRNLYNLFLEHYNLKQGNTEVSSEITKGSETL